MTYFLTVGTLVLLMTGFALLVRNRIGKQLRQLESRIYARLRELIDSLEQRLNAAQKRAGQAGETAQAAQRSFNQLARDQKQLAGRVEPLELLAQNLNRTHFQRFERTLSESQLERFEKFWVPKLGLGLTARQVAYMSQAIASTEASSMGRLATNTADEVLRILVARSVARPDAVLMEIGSLFGLNLILLHRFCSPFFPQLKLIALDPLDGYYGSEHLDPLTGLPINEAVFWKNLSAGGVPDGAVRLVKEFSTSESAKTAVAGTRVDYLLIDGDHSYAGVKNDFERFQDLVPSGGYILFDDYANVAEWPDVTRFVDDEIRGREDLEFVGADWRTVVFRRK